MDPSELPDELLDLVDLTPQEEKTIDLSKEPHIEIKKIVSILSFVVLESLLRVYPNLFKYI